MNISVFSLLVVLSSAFLADALFFDGGTITISAGGLALAGLLGLKAAAFKGYAIGRSSSSRRSYSSGRKSYR